MSGAFAPPSTGGSGSVDLASPGAIGSSTPNTAVFTDLTIGNRIFQTPGSVQTLMATSTISSATSSVPVTSASAISLTSNPQISAPLKDWQKIEIVNIGSNAITFANGNGLILGQSIPLYPGKILSLRYLSAYTSWVLDSLIPESVALTGAPTVPDLGLNTSSSAIANSRYVNQSNRPALRAYRATTNQTGLTHAAFTQLIFNTEALDTNLIHDPTTGFVAIPASAGGLYLVSAGMYLNGNNKTLAIGVFSGATEVQRLNDLLLSSDTASAIKGCIPVQLAGGDVINIRGYYDNVMATARQMLPDAALSFLTMVRLNI